MINRNFLQYLLCCAIPAIFSGSLQAQPVPIKEFTLKYKLAKTVEASNGNIRTKLSSTEINMAGNRMRITNELRPGVLTTYLYDPDKTSSQVFIHDANDSITYQEEYRRKELLDIVLAEEKDGKTELLTDTRTINGWSCQKAIVTFDSTAITVWYTDSHILKPAGIGYALKDIPGLPVIISFNEGNRLNMSIVTSIHNTYMLEKFSIPDNPAAALAVPNAERYRVVNARTERTMIMQQMFAGSPPIMEVPEEMKPFILTSAN
ncbi:MAG: hypothetical protein J0H92_18155 [Sphingobacteriales bacterium]|nr:hypothetical protein [Sphingobacteriales bacterium]OJW36786.1 MAG: hypothetical protein BGO54_06690 [Sphingobacteriales bacterium 46-32]